MERCGGMVAFAGQSSQSKSKCASAFDGGSRTNRFTILTVCFLYFHRTTRFFFFFDPMIPITIMKFSMTLIVLACCYFFGIAEAFFEELPTISNITASCQACEELVAMAKQSGCEYVCDAF